MKKEKQIISLLQIFTVLIFSAFFFNSFGEKIKQSQVPSAVIDSFTQNYPKADIEKTSKETKNSTTYYEIESKQGKGNLDVLYDSLGNAVEIEESINEDSIPATVKNALNQKYPDAKIKKVEKLTKNGQVSYEIQLDTKQGEKEITVDKNGNITTTNNNEAD